MQKMAKLNIDKIWNKLSVFLLVYKTLANMILQKSFKYRIACLEKNCQQIINAFSMIKKHIHTT